MARQNTLLRLNRTLLARREDLYKALADELTNLRDFKAADSIGDAADWAFEAGSDEMSSQLEELEARELSQIERALSRLKEGTYGICEGGSENCQKKIPLSRLNALPYATLCINCEREMEKHPEWQDQAATGHWGEIFDWEAFTGDQRINLSEIEMGLSSNRRVCIVGCP